MINALILRLIHFCIDYMYFRIFSLIVYQYIFSVTAMNGNYYYYYSCCSYYYCNNNENNSQVRPGGVLVFFTVNEGFNALAVIFMTRYSKT